MAKKIETTVLLEREYIIPLRREWLKTPQYKRVPKSIKAIKKFITRHMKVPERDESQVKINRWLNQELWFRGIRKPPAKIKVKARKFIDRVEVELVEIPEKIKWQMAREAKMLEGAQKIKEVKKEVKPGEKKEEEDKKEEKKPEEKKEDNMEEKKEERKEKIEAVKEAGLQHAQEEAKQHKHETAHHKEKVTPRRMALQK